MFSFTDIVSYKRLGSQSEPRYNYAQLIKQHANRLYTINEGNARAVIGQ